MWQLLFWGSAAIVAYAYVGYPLVLYILGRFRRLPTASRSDELPSVCLIVSAFNEEKVLREKLTNSVAQRYPDGKLTIVVASDGSTDDTVEIAGEFARAGVHVNHSARRRGKSAVLNDVIPQLDADVVCFTDANALFAPDAIEKLARHFAVPEIGCVVGRLRYVDGNATSVGKGEGAYWRYESHISRLESRLGSVLVANGSIFAIRRDLFSPLYPEVANDFQIPFDIAAKGSGVVYEPEAIAYERTAAYWHEEFGRKVRIILRGLSGFAVMRKRIRGLRLFQLVSHKVLRWGVGVFMGVAFVANIFLARDSLFYTIPLAMQVALYVAAMLGWMQRDAGRARRTTYIPFYFTLVNTAALVAMTRFATGRRLTVWDKAESTRLSVDPAPSSAEVVALENIGNAANDAPARVEATKS